MVQGYVGSYRAVQCRYDNVLNNTVYSGLWICFNILVKSMLWCNNMWCDIILHGITWYSMIYMMWLDEVWQSI